MKTTHTVLNAECLTWLRMQPTDSVDLVVTSPPYEDARHLSSREKRLLDIGRKHGIDTGFVKGEFRLSGQAWVDWIVPIVVECCRVSRGLVCFVVEGRTKNFNYSCTPLLLSAAIASGYSRSYVRSIQGKAMQDHHLYPFSIYQRKPIIYRRVGIPGSGGPDFLRNDYEFVLCFSRGRKLMWSDNTAMGSPPKYSRGGNFSHHTQNGRLKNGKEYPQLAIANPGNIIECHGGGGHLGSKYAHDNEAPFPLKLADFLIRTFCPPADPIIEKHWKDVRKKAFGTNVNLHQGTVLDPFAGSGTVAHASALSGRNSISIDLRRSQFNLMKRRLRNECKAVTARKSYRSPSKETFTVSHPFPPEKKLARKKRS